jgi:hypothetical protein
MGKSKKNPKKTTREVGPKKARTSSKQSLDPLVESMSALIRTYQDLSKRAVEAYTPLVDSIICSKTKDVNRIEFTLDYMLEFASDPNMLVLYKRLCRYLYSIDPAAAATYVQYYRERWDSEDD